MSGAAALRWVLLADAPMLLLVSAEDIVAGPLPLNVGLPVVTLEKISRVDLNIPSPAAERFVRERVQATAHASTYDEMVAVLKAVRKAAADQLYPSVPDMDGVTIHTDGDGPELFNPLTSVHSGSLDFMIKYSEER